MLKHCVWSRQRRKRQPTTHQQHHRLRAACTGACPPADMRGTCPATTRVVRETQPAAGTGDLRSLLHGVAIAHSTRCEWPRSPTPSEVGKGGRRSDRCAAPRSPLVSSWPSALRAGPLLRAAAGGHEALMAALAASLLAVVCLGLVVMLQLMLSNIRLLPSVLHPLLCHQFECSPMVPRFVWPMLALVPSWVLAYISARQRPGCSTTASSLLAGLCCLHCPW